MTEKYDEVFNAYKKYIEDESQYSARVVKYNTNTSLYFPLVTCALSNIQDTDNCTIDMIEKYFAFYLTIDIYTKDKTKGANVKTASYVINEELTKLTLKFFGEKLGMKLTLCRPTPNLDNDVLRTTMQYQCLIGNARGNIIRR